MKPNAPRKKSAAPARCSESPRIQTFQKNEILKSEGSLHFSKTEKGWAAEDKNDY